MAEEDLVGKINKLIEQEGKNIVEFLKRKNNDYSASSFRGVKLLERNEARILDKMYRIINIHEGLIPNFESIEESYNDLLGYILIRGVIKKL